MTGAQPRTSSIQLYKQLEILPVPLQYVHLLVCFIINNEDMFQTNSSIHNINIMHNQHLHRPNANLGCFQKSTLYASIKISTTSITILKNKAQ
jgi:hypothetical protein